MLEVVPRNAFRPQQLISGPFSIDEARAAGLGRRSLGGASWRRIGPGIYISAGLAQDPLHKIEATRRRLPAGAAFSGLTAAWLHGLNLSRGDPIEVTVPPGAGVS